VFIFAGKEMLKDSEDATLTQKLNQLYQHFSKGSDLSKRSTSDKSSHADFLSGNELAKELFAKADPEFLASHTLEELVKITNSALECLAAHGSKSSAVTIQSQRAGDYSALYICLGDRPFIVNTILECTSVCEASINCLLHPVLGLNGNRVSLTYLEVGQVSAEALALLSARLESSLSLLTLATDDFSPILVRVETLARLIGSSDKHPSANSEERLEVAEFLRWLANGGFVFLGLESYSSVKNQEFETSESYGISKGSESFSTELREEVRRDLLHLVEQNHIFGVTKLRLFSPVHRHSRLLHIALQEISPDGRVGAIYSIVGVLTSRALGEESSSMPIIRQKLQKLLAIEGALKGSHDYKTILNIIDRMPKEDALCLEVDELHKFLRAVLAIHNRNETKVVICLDRLKRGASVLIAMSRDRFTSDLRRKIQAFLENSFGVSPGGSEFQLDLSRRAIANLYFYIPLAGGSLEQIDLQVFREKIERFSRNWSDNLRELIEESPLSNSAAVFVKYASAFSSDYQALHSGEECLLDISNMERLSASAPLRVGMFTPKFGANSDFYVGFYKLGSEITISRAVPILENAGLEVINERTFGITPLNSEPIYIHRFLVRSYPGVEIEQAHFEAKVAPGLQSVLAGESLNDKLNALMLSASLDIRAVSLLRVYASHLWQLRKLPSRETISNALVRSPKAAQMLWQIFDNCFNPEHAADLESRRAAFKLSKAQFLEHLRAVSDVVLDRVLRYILGLIEATVRTNFYTGARNVALKVNSERVDWMPNPKPKFEVFVVGPEFEGVHLRAELVARGGIRWSERKDDFRSEVLGLMKTQKIKNALIVPSGAKGGFVVYNLPSEQKLVPAAVEAIYKQYIRALLSLADNREGEKVVHPKGVLCYDGADPYFVVAADKGTATFSDVANRIAQEEFNFWMADAFASGGSNGYDHKLYGITAKGAWESVKRHFNDLQIDTQASPFTCVGIGDMSGDVFGNGLLLSDNLKLLAAFDHRHIFVDPNPDPKISFKERQRLFQLPRSQWTDYDLKLISTGGGIFKRLEKEIQLNPEIRRALSIADDVPDTLNGEQLINLILKTKVDLLWNGGIGTYVKSRLESHSDVSDATNDNVRVNADELRAKVIGEGGNLGFTQRARIEFAARGGRINTDAIDNSGGVDLSDHEVNLKILFSSLMRDSKITLEERNKLLKEMANSVTESVLEHNRNHALSLSLGSSRSKRRQDYYKSLIAEVHRLGFVDRNLENLPDDEELRARTARQEGIYRPELAVCLAAVKLWIKSELLKSDLLKDPALHDLLLAYFPDEMQKRFKNEILAHPLAANITAAQVVNTLIDQVGISFVHRICLTTSIAVPEVVKSSIIAERVLQSSAIREELWKFDNVKECPHLIEGTQDISGAQRFVGYWLLSTFDTPLSITDLVQLFGNSYQKISADFEKIFRYEDLEIFTKRLSHYAGLGLSEGASRQLAAAPVVALILEVLWVQQQTQKDAASISETWYNIARELKISPLLKLEPGMDLSSRWEKEIVVSSYQEIRRALSRIAIACLQKSSDQAEIRSLVRSAPNYTHLVATIMEIRQRSSEVAAFSILAKKLQSFEKGFA